MWDWLLGSCTKNLSLGERPVCLPVFTTSGPWAAARPSCRRIASSNKGAVVRLRVALRTGPNPYISTPAFSVSPASNAIEGCLLLTLVRSLKALTKLFLASLRPRNSSGTLDAARKRNHGTYGVRWQRFAQPARRLGTANSQLVREADRRPRARSRRPEATCAMPGPR